MRRRSGDVRCAAAQAACAKGLSEMRNNLLKTVLVMALALSVASLPSCGGGSHRSVPIPAPSGNAGDGEGSGLVLLKDTAGAPTGIRVYWWRDNAPDVTGYYLYRDTQPITTSNPALRVNGGNPVAQPGQSVTSITFDDLFAARAGLTYYYRATTVDLDGDESALSTELSITVAQFAISSFAPIQGRVGSLVYIYGSYFGTYDSGTDAVYFTGVKNDKGPSALFVSFVQAQVVSWNNDQIIARVPIGATVGPIRVTCAGTNLETVGDFACISPYILSVSPDPATAGVKFDIYGANFGLPDGSNLLMVDDVAYGGVFSSWQSDHVSCTLPAGLTTGLSKIEMLIGSEVTNPCYCDILGSNAPRIDKLTPDYGVAGSTTVTVTGRNFGNVAADIVVYFHGIDVLSGSFLTFSNTSITFAVPTGAKKAGDVYVHNVPSGEDSNKWLYHALPSSANYTDSSVIAGLQWGEYSDAAYGPGDTEYVIFTDQTKGFGDKLYLAYLSGPNWVTEMLYDSAGGEVRWPRLQVDSAGVVHYAYQRGPGGASPTEVRYGQWDGGVIMEETVYTGGTGTHHGDWLALEVFEDSTGGLNAFLFWGDGKTKLYGSHELDGETVWTTDLVYTADVAFSEEVGRACSIDCFESSVGSPPGNLWILATSELYSPMNTPTHQVLESSWDISAGWGSSLTGVGSSSQINETCALWSDFNQNMHVLWCDGAGVYWSDDLFMGGSTQTVVTGGGPYGAALGFLEDPVDGNRFVAGSAGGTDFFWAYYDSGLDTWTSEVQSNPEGRSVTQSGRGGAAISSAFSKGFCSAYDPDMRDVIAVREDKSTGPLVLSWSDIGDHYATPGYDLSNRALTLNSTGVSFAVFGDLDPVTGQRTLWLGTTTVSAGPPGWSMILLDSAPSGTLGHACIAADSNDNLHIAYLKGTDVMYTSGNTINGFSTPKVLENVGAVTTAPQIALGVYSPLDVNVLTPSAGASWDLLLLRSNTGMGTHATITTLSSPSAITQYGLALKGNGDPVCAAYLDSPTNALTVWDGTTQLTRSFGTTLGMNAGMTLSLDDGGRYCATLADPASTGENYLLRWNNLVGDYQLATFGVIGYPTNSMMMSQWRNEYGPYIFYSLKYNAFVPGWADLVAYVPRAGGPTDTYYASSDGNTAIPPVFLTGDPFAAYGALSLYYYNTSEYRYLAVGYIPPT
jgi:hypothetical protein